MNAQQTQTDFTLTFEIEGLDVRGRLVRLGPALEGVLSGHDYPEPVAELLGETVTLGVVLASALKYDGVFSLQTQSDGPVNTVITDVTSDGALRGYARFDGVGVNEAAKKDGAPVPRFLGSGHMAFTVDQGEFTDRYQGITELDGATLSDCAHHYFRNSEQLETAIFLAADIGNDARGFSSGALMVQRLPSTDGALVGADAEDGWRRAVALLASLSRAELLDATLSAETLLYRLYHEDGVRVFEPKALFHRCRCSLEKVISTLKSFPRAEVSDDDGAAHITCEFCKASYDFTADEVTALFEGVSAGKQS